MHHLIGRVVLIISGWREKNLDPAVFELGVSSLAYVTVYKELSIVWQHGKNVITGTEREYSHAELKAQRHNRHVCQLFENLEDPINVWISQGDKLGALPANFYRIVTTKNALFVGITHESKPLHEIQSHPEVTYKRLCRLHVQWEARLGHDKIRG